MVYIYRYIKETTVLKVEKWAVNQTGYLNWTVKSSIKLNHTTHSLRAS